MPVVYDPIEYATYIVEKRTHPTRDDLIAAGYTQDKIQTLLSFGLSFSEMLYLKHVRE